MWEPGTISHQIHSSQTTHLFWVKAAPSLVGTYKGTVPLGKHSPLSLQPLHKFRPKQPHCSSSLLFPTHTHSASAFFLSLEDIRFFHQTIPSCS